MQAIVIHDAITLQAVGFCEGQMVVETACADFTEYKRLPQVISYGGRELGKTGWSSDRQYACYKSGVSIAHGKK